MRLACHELCQLHGVHDLGPHLSRLHGAAPVSRGGGAPFRADSAPPKGELLLRTEVSLPQARCPSSFPSLPPPGLQAAPQRSSAAVQQRYRRLSPPYAPCRAPLGSSTCWPGTWHGQRTAAKLAMPFPPHPGPSSPAQAASAAGVAAAALQAGGSPLPLPLALLAVLPLHSSTLPPPARQGSRRHWAPRCPAQCRAARWPAGCHRRRPAPPRGSARRTARAAG